MIDYVMAVLLFLVWITEVALVRELRKGREQQGNIRRALKRVEGAMDTMTDKIVKLMKKFGA